MAVTRLRQSHQIFSESRHIVNMVTYIIYINEKRQNSKPQKNNYLQALPWDEHMGVQTAAANKQPASAGTLGGKGRCEPSAQVLTL